MAEILIVDDDAQLRQSFGKILAAEGHEVRVAASGEEGLEIFTASMPDLVIMDVRMHGLDGIKTLQIMHEREPRLPVIIMTAYSTTQTAIEATKLGAFDYILKPFEIPAVLNLIRKALGGSRLSEAVGKSAGNGADAEHDDPHSPHNLARGGRLHGRNMEDVLVGKSQAMHQVYKAIGKTAPTDALVLVRGESGTGKELVARALHQHSQRAGHPFVVINCVAIPENLLESELFGYERGAFTGANTRRIGKIEQASHGTIFLDEIGDMPMSIQAKLLRLLQEKQIERLGGRQTVPVDVRIVAATNRDLEAAVAAGAFREDLYYRLNVIALWLPPLRERKEDIEPLARSFILRLSAQMDMPAPDISPGALDLLNAHSWPGNVRELKNALQKALIFCRGATLSREDVAEVLSAGPTDQTTGKSDGAGGTGGIGGTGDGLGDDHNKLEVLTEYLRRELTLHAGSDIYEQLMTRFSGLILRQSLKICQGNRSRAARMLGLSRPTLLAKLEKSGLKDE